MRITIEIDEQLLADAERLATEMQRTLSDVVADALRRILATQGKSSKDRFTLPKVGASGLRPGVDLCNSAALLDLMEERGET